MLLTTLIVIVGLINAEKIGKDGPPTNCICRKNGTICSQPGCARGDNHNCNYLGHENIEYSIRKHRFNQISLYACACPNYKGFFGDDANVYIFEYDYAIGHNYTTCDNIVTSKEVSISTMSTAFVKKAVSCCYYCCTNFTVGAHI